MVVNLNYSEIEKRISEAADALGANSKLKSSEYLVPVLGVIFLCYADYKFTRVTQELAAAQECSRRRTVRKLDYQAWRVMYLPEAARLSNLLKLSEGADIGKAINEVLKAIREENLELDSILPRTKTQYFTHAITSIFQQVKNLILKNRNLKQTCDLLLPNLTSAAIDMEKLNVREAEEDEVAAVLRFRDIYFKD